MKLYGCRVWASTGRVLVRILPVASGHTVANTPDLFRTPKLTATGPGEYWTGGLSGNTLGCR